MNASRRWNAASSNVVRALMFRAAIVRAATVGTAMVGAAIVGAITIGTAIVWPVTAKAQTTATTTAATAKPFRVLAPSTRFDGRTRAELLILGYNAKVTASKAAIATPNCAERPQFGDGAGAQALATKLFTLPAQLGKTMTCTMSANSTLMIDHIGVICNDSKDHQASIECINSRFEPLKNYRVTIDGIDLGINRFKLTTEKFVVDLKRESPYGLQAGKWRLRAGGWPVLIAGLTPGEHTVKTSYKLGKNRQSTTVTLTVSP